MHTLTSQGGALFKYAIYARISKEEVGSKDNCNLQISVCREWAEQNISTGMLVGVFSDPDVSISRLSKKPRLGWPKVVALIEARQIDGVLATEVERLYRQPKEAEILIDLAHGKPPRPVTILDVDGRRYDLATTNGEHDFRAHVNNASREAAKISDRSRRKKLAHAREGRPSGGARPFGYEADLVTVREGEAELIRKAADRVLAGDSLRSIVAEWNARGITTPVGKPWARSPLKRLLLSPRVVGRRQHQGTVIGPAIWPAILDRDEAELVRRILTDHAHAIRSRFTGRSYLLTGILECSQCSTRLYGGLHTNSRNGSKVRQYTCKRGPGFGGCGRVHQLADPLDQLVSEVVLVALDSPGLGAALRARSQNGQEAELLVRLQADEGRLAQLADDYVDGTFDKATYVRQKARVIERLEQTRLALDRVASNRTLVALPPAGRLRVAWAAASVDQRRAIIAAVVEKVLLHPAGSGAKRLWQEPNGDWGYDPSKVEICWKA
jgi:site-specific DNA recombinase